MQHENDFVQCLNCRVGTLRLTRATYAQWHGQQLVLVPNVLARKCDVCGDFAYEDEALTRVELLLGSHIERPKPRNASKSQSGPGNQPVSDESEQRSAK